MQLYKPPCWSVKLCKNSSKGDLTCVTAPAHQYATDVVLYTALFKCALEHVFMTLCNVRLSVHLSAHLSVRPKSLRFVVYFGFSSFWAAVPIGDKVL